jgi:hypothetical protein
MRTYFGSLEFCLEERDLSFVSRFGFSVRLLVLLDISTPYDGSGRSTHPSTMILIRSLLQDR